MLNGKEIEWHTEDDPNSFIVAQWQILFYLNMFIHFILIKFLFLSLWIDYYIKYQEILVTLIVEDAFLK